MSIIFGTNDKRIRQMIVLLILHYLHSLTPASSLTSAMNMEKLTTEVLSAIPTRTIISGAYWKVGINGSQHSVVNKKCHIYSNGDMLKFWLYEEYIIPLSTAWLIWFWFIKDLWSTYSLFVYNSIPILERQANTVNKVQPNVYRLLLHMQLQCHRAWRCSVHRSLAPWQRYRVPSQCNRNWFRGTQCSRHWGVCLWIKGEPYDLSHTLSDRYHLLVLPH